MVFAGPGTCNARPWSLGDAKLFLTLYLGDDGRVIWHPVDLSVQEFVTQKNPTKVIFREIC